jgi:hypothetical protein
MAFSKQGKYGTNPVVVMANSMLSVTVRYVVMVKAGGGGGCLHFVTHCLCKTPPSSLLISSNRFLVEITSFCSFIFFR